jgi:hypothetical protein
MSIARLGNVKHFRSALTSAAQSPAGGIADSALAGQDHALKSRTLSPVVQLFIDRARELAKLLAKAAAIGYQRIG